MKSASLRLKVVASVLVGAFVCQVFAQQPPESGEQTQHKTRVCAIEDETRVDSADNPGTSHVLKPGYCVDCWTGVGCGSPFLAAGLLGLLGGSTGAAGAAAAVGVVGGVIGGLSASGALGGGGGNGPPPPGPPVGPPGGGGGFPPGPPPVIPPPHPLPTPPSVSPFR